MANRRRFCILSYQLSFSSPMTTEPNMFPKLSCNDVLSFQFSSWYPRFAHISIKSTIIRPLSQDFLRYLHQDGVILPDGSEDVCVSLQSAMRLFSTVADHQTKPTQTRTRTRATHPSPMNRRDSHFQSSTLRYGNALQSTVQSSPS